MVDRVVRVGFLDEIIASTKRRIDDSKEQIGDERFEELITSRPPPQDFAAALQADDVTAIAEIKRATPAKGLLAPDLDAAKTAAAYADGGAAAISVLTEPNYFKGSFEDLQAATGPGLPVLRKDFIIDPFQLLEARA